MLLVKEREEEEVCHAGVMVIAPDNREQWMDRITNLLDRFDQFSG